MAEESNQKLKTQPDDADDDDLSSGGLIQKAISEYEHSTIKCNFVLPPTDEITVVNLTTPEVDRYTTRRSATANSNSIVTPDSSMSSSLSAWSSSIQKAPVDQTSNANKKSKLRHNVTYHSEKPTHSSTAHKSHFRNNDDDDDGEVQLMKVERKRAATRDQQKKSYRSKKYNNVDDTAKSSPSIAAMGFVKPSPPFSSQPLCTFCGNRGYMCHHYQFSGYCTKACMSYLQMNRNGWEAGFNVDNMERVFSNAYNEARRVTYEERFGYYCPGWVEIPECMKETALKTAVDLGFNPKLCSELREHNEDGKKKYEEAQTNQRA